VRRDQLHEPAAPRRLFFGRWKRQDSIPRDVSPASLAPEARRAASKLTVVPFSVVIMATALWWRLHESHAQPAPSAQSLRLRVGTRLRQSSILRK
jgi:hypothetical protein